MMIFKIWWSVWLQTQRTHRERDKTSFPKNYHSRMKIRRNTTNNDRGEGVNMKTRFMKILLILSTTKSHFLLKLLMEWSMSTRDMNFRAKTTTPSSGTQTNRSPQWSADHCLCMIPLHYAVITIVQCHVLNIFQDWNRYSIRTWSLSSIPKD